MKNVARPLHVSPSILQLLAICLALAAGCGCGDDPEPTEPTPAEPVTSTEEPTADEEEPTADETPGPIHADTNHPSEALVAALARVPDEQRARVPPGDSDLEAGKATFETLCASCHGTVGRGDGPAASVLVPPPGDLTDSGRLQRSSASEKAHLIAQGVGGGSAMPPFEAALSTRQIWDVVAYVQTLAASAPDAGGGDPQETALDPHDPPAPG